MDWLVLIFFFLSIIAVVGIGAGVLDGRRKFKLALKQEERLLIEARTRELEAQNQRVELEYRQAQLELDRFDRTGSTAVSPVPAGAEPPAPPEP